MTLPVPKWSQVYLDGKPSPFVGPQDIALAIIGAVFKTDMLKIR